MTTLRWSLEEDLIGYENAELAAIGLSTRKLDEVGREKAVEMVAASPLNVSSLNWASGFTGYNRYPLKEAVYEAADLIRLAGDLRAGVVTVIAGPKGSHIRPHATRLVVGALKELGQIAGNLGVELALQPMAPIYRQEWSFLSSLRETLDLLDRVDEPSVGLLAHTYHLYREPGLPGLIDEAASRTKLIRVADCSGRPKHENDQLLPGEGIAPIRGMVSALRRAGYHGYYEAEVWSQSVWSDVDRYDTVLGQCREFCHRLTPAPKRPTRHTSRQGVFSAVAPSRPVSTHGVPT